jgi:hypothetical protein
MSPERSKERKLPSILIADDDKGVGGRVTIHHSFNEIMANDWNALIPSDSPILRHEFLSAFETSGCVIQNTGWEPHHLGLYDAGTLVAAAPCYLKYHSYGEYIFDWDWARAYQRARIAYYPKLLLAIPFTPISGRRLLTHPNVDRQLAGSVISAAVLQLAKDTSASSIHSLFTTASDNELLKTAGFIQRRGNQFHWENHDYENFTDFLSALNSKRRKNILRERRTIEENHISFRWLSGHNATTRDWSFFYSCYQATIEEHGAIPYLNKSFFQLIGETMPNQILLLIAQKQEQDIAAAFFLKGERSLYGRYWGTISRVSNLHFETCFYQPIEYCIQNHLKRFEAGAQGEHKLNRGLIPTSVQSMHWLSHPDFFEAVKHYSQEELESIQQYQNILQTHSPYKN